MRAHLRGCAYDHNRPHESTGSCLRGCPIGGELTPAEKERLRLAHRVGLTLHIHEPDCPRCGLKMGPQTQPLDGSWWCGNLACGYHFEPAGDVKSEK